MHFYLPSIRFVRRLVAAVLVVSAVALTGCSSDDNGDTDVETSATQQTEADTNGATDSNNEDESAGSSEAAGGNENAGTVVASVGDQSFTFTPGMCVISETTSVISGPGQEDTTGTPAHIEIDLHDEDGDFNGMVTIHRGEDSGDDSDDYVYSFFGSGDDYTLDVENDHSGLSIESSFSDSVTGDELGLSLISVNCG